MRVRVIAFEGKILEAECEYIGHGPVDLHLRQPARHPGKLEPGLFEMVEIQMGVAKGVNEGSGGETGDVRHHHGQQRVGRDVERYAKKYVGGALIELAREPAVRHVELKQAVA